VSLVVGQQRAAWLEAICYHSERMVINEASSVIQSELGPKEQLLWAGVPRKGFALRKSDAMMIPFSIMWGGFAIVWEVGVLRTSNELFMKLWGIPFVVIGLYMMVGRFFIDIWRRDRTFYGVTNERIVMVTRGLFGKEIKSLDLRSLHEMTIDEQNSGSGTITFGLSAPPVKETHRSFRLSSPSQGNRNEDSERYYPAFEMITDAKTVYNLIRQAQQSI